MVEGFGCGVYGMCSVEKGGWLRAGTWCGEVSSEGWCWGGCVVFVVYVRGVCEWKGKGKGFLLCGVMCWGGGVAEVCG